MRTQLIGIYQMKIFHTVNELTALYASRAPSATPTQWDVYQDNDIINSNYSEDGKFVGHHKGLEEQGNTLWDVSC